MTTLLPAIFASAGFALALWLLPILHPTTLWTASWAVSTVLYAFKLLPYRDLSWLTALLLCGAVAVFALGAPAGAMLARRRAAIRPGSLAAPAPGAVEIAAALAFALTSVALAAFVAHLVAKFGLIRALRISPEVKVYLSSNEAPASSVYVEFAIASVTLCALAATRAARLRARRVWLALAALSAASVYFSTSRGFIAVALASGLIALGLSRERMPRRRLVAMTVAAALLVLVLFVGLGTVIGKTYGNSTIGQFENFFSDHPALRSLALPYQDATASIPALDLLVRYSPTLGVAHGCATVPIACGVIRKLGVHVVRVPVAGQFTQGPIPWNAYTFLDRFLIDWGVALTLLLVALTGAAAGYMWQRARSGSTLGVLVYAVFAPALVAAYRQNLIELVGLCAVLAWVLLTVGARLSRLQGLASRLAPGRAG